MDRAIAQALFLRTLSALGYLAAPRISYIGHRIDLILRAAEQNNR